MSFFKELKGLKPKKRAILLFLAIAFAAFFALFSPYGLFFSIKIEKLKNEKLIKLEKLRKERDSLSLRLKKLKTDSLEIERIAREKYGMIKPGEEVYILKKSGSK